MGHTLSAIERLRAFLRPPGKGLYTHSTGGSYAEHLLQSIYGTSNAKEVQDQWENALQRIRRVEGVVLGIPSDTGSGIMRGSNFGPIGLREAYLERYQAIPKNVMDIGDVIVVPQLLHDSMLSQSQIEATRLALYGSEKLDLPVSPLSIAEGALLALHELNPDIKIFLIGGDHSVTWPAMQFCHHAYGDRFGILHFDAHTDMLEKRLGVTYCFATWAFHARKLVRPQALVQVGIRTSAKTKEHWTSQFPIQQYWSSEVNQDEAGTINRIIEHFKTLKIEGLYISNDIDGTDSGFAPATGTPESNGLRPDFVKALIQEARAHFKLIGGDVVELAPPLSGLHDFRNEKTSVLAADYLKALL